MTETDESLARRESYRTKRRAYLEAVASCHAIENQVKRIFEELKRIERAPFNPTSRLSPPPMPEVIRSNSTVRKFPTEAEINDALNGRDNARAYLIAAWNVMSRSEQEDCAPPPEELGLQKARA